MKIEAVTVCVNYGDFLSAIIANNKCLFDKWIIVTDTKDEQTKKVCDFYAIDCIQTDIFYTKGGFNKAAGINEGLKYLEKDGWIIHLDADIFLPPLTRHILNNLELNTQAIYGVDRYCVRSFPEWNKYITDPKPLHDRGFLLHMANFDVGARLVHYWGEGFVPIGFFQMWHPTDSGVLEYSEEECTINHTDVLFARKFLKENRKLIPDIICFHLESESVKMGENWNGRKTKYFGLEEKDLTLNVIGTINPIIKSIVKTEKEVEPENLYSDIKKIKI